MIIIDPENQLGRWFILEGRPGVESQLVHDDCHSSTLVGSSTNISLIINVILNHECQVVK